MIKRPILLLIAIFSMLLSCEETDLEKTIYHPDPEFQGLPIYSEWGYNTFGAYYDKAIFKQGDMTPLKVIVKNGTTTLLFKGQRGASYYGENESMSLRIQLVGLKFKSYSELISLNNSIIQLESSECKIIFTIGGVNHETEVLNGHIEFKRVQKLLVDMVETELILSGLFEFQVILNDEPISVSHGRFDVGVGKYNFFLL